MKPPTTLHTIATAIVALTLLSGSLVDAKEAFVKRIPNGGQVPSVKALGHSDGTGNRHSLNAFGWAFASAGEKWTPSLWMADSDGDGQTNGQELGDPCCEWSEGTMPRYTTGLSHPSDATKTTNASLWSEISCPPIATGAASVAAMTAAMAMVVVGAVAAQADL